MVGLIPFVMLIASSLWREVQRLSVNPRPTHLWRVVYFVWLILYNCTENTGLAYNDLFWMLTVGIAVEPLAKAYATEESARRRFSAGVADKRPVAIIAAEPG